MKIIVASNAAMWQVLDIDSDTASIFWFWKFSKSPPAGNPGEDFMRKKFNNQNEAEAFRVSLHPLLGAAIRHQQFVAEKTEESREADEAHDSIAALEAAIERGDNLAENALEFFRGTMWGQEFASGDRSFSNALRCVDLDVSDYDYRPAQSHAQAVKFIKRLRASVKWIKSTNVITAIPEFWAVDVDDDIGLEEKTKPYCSRREAEEELEWKRSNGYIKDPLARIEEHVDGFFKFRLVWTQSFSIRQRRMDNQYDPSDSVSGWGNAFGD